MTKLTALPGWVRAESDEGHQPVFIKASFILGVHFTEEGHPAFRVWGEDVSLYCDGYTTEDLWRVVEDALRLERERDKT